ncbi:hypothetical protein [Pelosinus propionicus]|uniref:Uncharacterized protein n=1 Tax=Pelosinus propionicus DSM 13327 TaxID=1123291 RepID=A0A1I4I0N6_9FIRM|nr:hypothetical protein [Pelosinus propionicus]SFL47919.1 hypothetical protein SAMN04490355_100611 [Pelosinus propionicus DSM 13327]
MVYEMMRAMAGPYLSSMVDSYISHQDVLNGAVVAGGLAWRVYKQKKWKQIRPKEKQKEIFFNRI